jgi:hypothetical protein
VPKEYRQLDAFLTLELKVLLHDAKYGDAISVLGANCFPTFAKVRLPSCVTSSFFRYSLVLS